MTPGRDRQGKVGIPVDSSEIFVNREKQPVDFFHFVVPG